MPEDRAYRDGRLKGATVATTPERQLANMHKAFKTYTSFVKDGIVLVDDEMRRPSSPERGGRIAQLMNQLNLQTDAVRRFTLELDWNGRPLKRKAG